MIELTEEHILSIIKALENNNNELQTEITIMFLKSKLEE